MYPELDECRAGWRFQPAPDALADRVIMVTGAGTGIGATAARTFAAHGAHVILLGRRRQPLEAVFDWINEHTDTRPVIVPADLSVLASDHAEALRDAVDDEFGRLDGLLHNASLLGPKTPIAQYPFDTWQQVFQVNVHAVMLLCQSMEPLLRASASASVVLTSSSVGRQGRAYWGAYAASKFAVEGLMQILADEWEHLNIRVNSLNPGGTRTAMRANAYPGEDPATVPLPEAHMDLYLHLMTAGLRESGAALDARDWAGLDAG